MIKGVATDAVKLVASSSLPNTGLTVEVVEISKPTHFPVRVLGYEGPTLVRRIDFFERQARTESWSVFHANRNLGPQSNAETSTYLKPA